MAASVAPEVRAPGHVGVEQHPVGRLRLAQPVLANLDDRSVFVPPAQHAQQPAIDASASGRADPSTRVRQPRYSRSASRAAVGARPAADEEGRLPCSSSHPVRRQAIAATGSSGPARGRSQDGAASPAARPPRPALPRRLFGTARGDDLVEQPSGPCRAPAAAPSRVQPRTARGTPRAGRLPSSIPSRRSSALAVLAGPAVLAGQQHLERGCGGRGRVPLQRRHHLAAAARALQRA